MLTAMPYTGLMKTKALKLFFILLCTILLSSCQSRPNAYDTQGNPIYFKQYRGQYIVLNYWASWCKPCYQEIPEINALYQHYSHQIHIFGINYDQTSPEKLKKLVAHMGIGFPVLQNNPGPYFGIKDITGLPVTYIIDPTGKIVDILTGEQTEANLKKAMNLS